jgi:hypothetical protein
MTDVERITRGGAPRAGREGVLLVCAHADEAKGRHLSLEGAISLTALRPATRTAATRTSRATWRSRLIEVLTSFLVSRQVFPRAGKVVPKMRDLRYCLAQRASHISGEISGTTVSSRPIITRGTNRTPTPSATAGSTSSS